MIFHIIVTASIFAATTLHAAALPQRLVVWGEAPSLNFQSTSLPKRQDNGIPANARMMFTRDVAKARQDECASPSKWPRAKYWIVTVELESTESGIERTAPPRAFEPGCPPRAGAAPKRQSKFVVKPRPGIRIRTA